MVSARVARAVRLSALAAACNTDTARAHEDDECDGGQCCLIEGLGWCLDPTGLRRDTDLSLLHVALGDFDGDGRADVLALGTDHDGTVAAELHRGDERGGLAAASRPPIAACSAYPAHDDLDGDGATDLVSPTCEGDAAVLWADGNGGFVATEPIELPGDLRSTAALEQPGRPQRDLLLLTREQSSGVLVSLVADAPRRFAIDASTAIDAAVVVPAGIVVGDFDGDAWTDVILIGDGDGTLAMATGVGPGSFAIAKLLPVATAAALVDRADLDGDGTHDLLALAPDTRELVAILRTASGWNEVGSGVALAPPWAMTVVDVDRDGRDEVITASGPDSDLALWSLDRGAWSRLSTAPLEVGSVFVRIHDLDRDGIPDLVLGTPPTGFVVHRARPSPT